MSNSLAESVAQELRRLSVPDLEDKILVGKAIESACVQLDDRITSEALSAMNQDIPHSEAVRRIQPAASGSCALLALLDPRSSTVFVACVGDSRAVMGRRTSGDQQDWTTAALSTDQAVFNDEERQRIQAEHPGESPFDKESLRLLDCEVTRSFSDNRWKWPKEELRKWEVRFFGRPCLSDYLTPPYLSAVPVTTSAAVGPGDFLILATDGFWDHMRSNDDAVNLVSLWLRKNHGNDLFVHNTAAGQSQLVDRQRQPHKSDVERSRAYPFD